VCIETVLDLRRDLSPPEAVLLPLESVLAAATGDATPFWWQETRDGESEIGEIRNLTDKENEWWASSGKRGVNRQHHAR
jgi:hypothetical protein